MRRFAARPCSVRFGWPLAALALCLLAPAAVTAEEAASVAFHVGLFDVANSDKPLEAGLEVRLPTRHYGLQLTAGLAATEDGSGWVFGGLARDFQLAESWFVTPGFGVALYEDGDGRNLGGVIEFRSAIELSYRWGRSRLAAAFYHLSNAGIYDLNPGANSAILAYGYSLDR